MSVETNEVLTPRFCGVCGTQLVESRILSVSGYDIYTGEPLSVESVSRSCPNPTRGPDKLIGKPTLTYHRAYRFDGEGWA